MNTTTPMQSEKSEKILRH